MKSETGVVPWRGSPRLLATALVMPEEINSVRIYKKMANTTVLLLRQRQCYHIAEAPGKELGLGVLIDGKARSSTTPMSWTGLLTSW